jgi:hypothetical protein
MHAHAGTSNDPVTLKSVSNQSHVPRPAPVNQISRNRSQSVAGPKGETPGYDEVALARACPPVAVGNCSTYLQYRCKSRAEDQQLIS